MIEVFGRDNINIEPFLSGIENFSSSDNIKEPTKLEEKQETQNNQSEKKENEKIDKPMAENPFNRNKLKESQSFAKQGKTAENKLRKSPQFRDSSQIPEEKAIEKIESEQPKNKGSDNEDQNKFPRFSEIINNRQPLNPQKEEENNKLSSDQVTVTNLLKNPNSLKNVVDKYVENAKGTINKLKKNMNNILPRFKVKEQKRKMFKV